MVAKRRRPSARKKKAGKKYDYKKIASQTKGQVAESSERKGIGGSNIFKAGVEMTFYKPAADEDHTIDIIPFQAGDNMPIDMKTGEPMVAEGDWAYTYEYWQHRGIGPLENETVVCLERTYKLPCPICEHRKELVAEKSFDSDKMGELLCKQRNLYNIASYDTDKEEDKGAQLMNEAHFYFEKHISKLARKAVRRKRGSKLQSADPFKNFADPSDNGVSIEFSIEGAKTKNDFDTYMGHQLVERNYDLDSELMDAALQLDQIVEVLSYAELYEIYYDEKYEGDGESGEYEEEPEEEVAELEPEDDNLDELDRRELKKLLKEEDIDFTVYKGTDDGEIREAIATARAEAEEPEPEEPEVDTDELLDMDRKELKAILKEEDIDFTVFKGTDDDEIRDAIREARGGEEPEEEKKKSTRRGSRRGKEQRRSSRAKEKDVCPQNGTFGDDFDEFDECDNCKVFYDCEKQYNADSPDSDSD